MAGFKFHSYLGYTGQNPPVLSLPLGPSQSFDHGDPVYISSNQVIVTPKDGSVALDDEFFGFAFDAAQGPLSDAINASNYQAIEGLSTGGATENDFIQVVPPLAGVLMETTNFWTAVSGTTQDDIGGGDLLGKFQIASAASGEWGLVDAAATPADHVAAQVVAIYDEKGRPFDADVSDTTAGTEATKIVFRIANAHLLQWGIA